MPTKRGTVISRDEKKKFMPVSAKALFSVMNDTFGMKSHFLRATAVLWVLTSVSLILLNIIGWKQSSVLQIIVYILSTGLVMLISAFSATCFRYGDCPRAAYFSASVGIFVISASALNLD